MKKFDLDRSSIDPFTCSPLYVLRCFSWTRPCCLWDGWSVTRWSEGQRAKWRGRESPKVLELLTPGSVPVSCNNKQYNTHLTRLRFPHLRGDNRGTRGGGLHRTQSQIYFVIHLFFTITNRLHCVIDIILVDLGWWWSDFILKRKIFFITLIK